MSERLLNNILKLSLTFSFVEGSLSSLTTALSLGFGSMSEDIDTAVLSAPQKSA
jgi:hypothetical protein